MNEIEKELRESIDVKQSLLAGSISTIEEMARITVRCLRSGNTVYLIGNGGSAADAQHIAGEMVGRFERDRKALPVLALTTDTSVITAIANDYGYDSCFERQVEAFVKDGDMVIGISTSGNSEGILRAIRRAREKGAVTMGLTGQDGGDLKGLVDVCLQVPSRNTPRIQECHAMVGHILCSIVEKELFEGSAAGKDGSS
ncbi:MAG: D-sedoheptulose-7-phosphate isomerase [Candidatus Bathyanammoxibius sp.]